MARILSKVEVDKEIEALVKKQQAGEKIDSQAVGIQFITTLISKASAKDVEKEIYSFLGDVFEIDPEELRHMKPKKVKELFTATDAEEWKDFFTDVVQFIRQQS